MFDTGVFDTGVVVDRLVARARELNRLQAALLADLVAVADVTPNPEFVAFEVSSALTWTRRAATIQLDLADTIVRQLPAVHAAMMAGEVDLPKARVIADGVLALDADLARSIVEAILPQAPGLNTSQLRARLAKLLIQADPQAAAKRHKARVRRRRVELHNTEDSCAALFGLDLPADDALAASERLTKLARALKQAGDPRSMDQLRADTLLNLVLGNTVSGPTDGGRRWTGNGRCSCRGSFRGGGVELTGDLETLAGLTERPGELGGYGPVIADIARQVAQQQLGSPWTFTIRDPATGQIFTGAVRRRPTAAMARHVRARDRTCRAPGCRRIGIYADIDHTIAVEHGGLTVPSNLGLLCRYHHRAKHEGWWLLVQVRPGVFVWRSPLGRRYTVYPAAP